MLKCKYCGRYFKGKQETCLGCGAASFEEAEFKYDLVITTPPKGGYKIMKEQYITKKVLSHRLIVIGIILIIQFVFFDILYHLNHFNFTFKDFIEIVLLVLVFSSVFIIPGILILNENNKKIKRIKKLAENGILIKNLEYKYEKNRDFITVMYKTKKGVEIPITTKINRDCNDLENEDKNIDLLIDPTDYTNYYIDYEIY